jgi:hypothetical protein
MKKAMRILVVMAMMLGLGLGMGCSTIYSADHRGAVTNGRCPQMGKRIHVYSAVTYGDEGDINQVVLWSGYDGDRVLPPHTFTAHGYLAITEREDIAGEYNVLQTGLEKVRSK